MHVKSARSSSCLRTLNLKNKTSHLQYKMIYSQVDVVIYLEGQYSVHNVLYITPLITFLFSCVFFMEPFIGLFLLCLDFIWLSWILSIFSYGAMKPSFVLSAVWMASDNLSPCFVLKLFPQPSALWPKSPSMSLWQQQLPVGISFWWSLPTSW